MYVINSRVILLCYNTKSLNESTYNTRIPSIHHVFLLECLLVASAPGTAGIDYCLSLCTNIGSITFTKGISVGKRECITQTSRECSKAKGHQRMKDTNTIKVTNRV